jgi:hypothetical protein
MPDLYPIMKGKAYPQPPWFYQTARLPRLILRWQAAGTAITVNEFGTSRRS